MRSFTPTRRSACHTHACDAAITVTPNSCSSASMASITGQCGEGKKIASACGCARISARPMSSAAVTGMRPKSLMSLPHPMAPSALARAIRVRHHHFLAGEHLRRLSLRGDARRHLDAELRRERMQHVLRVLVAAGKIDRHATEKHEVDADGGEFTRRPHAHLVGRIDLALAAFDHRQRRDDEGHAGGNELVKFIREYFRAARRAGVADAGAVAIDVTAGRWLPIDHSCPVLLATV